MKTGMSQCGTRSRLSQVKEREIRWLWPDWIPAGKLSVLDGDPEGGKSTILADIAARVNTGPGRCPARQMALPTKPVP